MSFYINKRKLTFHLSKSRIRYHRKQWNEGQRAKVKREHRRLVRRLLENSVKLRNLTNTIKHWVFFQSDRCPQNHQFIYNITLFTPQNLAQPLSSISLGTTVIKRWKIGNNGYEKLGGRGGHTMCIIMVSVKMVNKISRSLRTNRYKLYPNRLNRLKRVQKLLRLKSFLKNDTNNRNVQFSQVNCKLDRCSTLSVSLFDT